MRSHKNKNNFLWNIRSNFSLQIIVCIILCSIIIIGFFAINNIIDFRKSREYTISRNKKLINDIENINIENSSMFIEGYAFLLDNNSIESEVSLILYNTRNNKEIWLDVENIERPDINSYFSSEYNYEFSGFIAKADKSKLQKNDCYEIIINIDRPNNGEKKRSTVSTNTFLYNDKLYNYNPNEFVEPNINIESNLLRDVFLNGNLCLDQKDTGMYIYQYEGKLYWIATEDFNFSEDGRTYFIYHTYTSQANKLPNDRIKSKYENLEFYFEQFEYTDEITEPYRVAVRNIPNNYAITYIQTGPYDIHNKQWIWEKYFHLGIKDIQ